MDFIFSSVGVTRRVFCPISASDKKFAEVATKQPEFTAENVKGTIVGFWTPEMFHGVSVAGYHLHFLSKEDIEKSE
ncbi:alpha-acetolactate decarboxylase [Streptococcus ferus]|uniref:Alpha-acetolactate decarboxylase n=1 Tax=Streptococcus ferus TaxID=1345 RepID=A0A2X3VKX2_9STRE|nr:alpha-acetolactate decarboxylase [Streptococcus ferus]